MAVIVVLQGPLKVRTYKGLADGWIMGFIFLSFLLFLGFLTSVKLPKRRERATNSVCLCSEEEEEIVITRIR